MGKNKQARRAENRKLQHDAAFQCLTDYSKKLDILQTQMTKLSLKISTTQRLQKTSSLALSHIQASSTETDRFYTQLGRMFLQEPLVDVITGLKRSIREGEEELPKLMQTMGQFEKLKSEQITQIKELNESLKAS